MHISLLLKSLQHPQALLYKQSEAANSTQTSQLTEPQRTAKLDAGARSAHECSHWALKHRPAAKSIPQQQHRHTAETTKALCFF
jgi:hypothetical protein